MAFPVPGHVLQLWDKAFFSHPPLLLKRWPRGVGAGAGPGQAKVSISHLGGVERLMACVDVVLVPLREWEKQQFLDSGWFPALAEMALCSAAFWCFFYACCASVEVTGFRESRSVAQIRSNVKVPHTPWRKKLIDNDVVGFGELFTLISWLMSRHKGGTYPCGSNNVTAPRVFLFRGWRQPGPSPSL